MSDMSSRIEKRFHQRRFCSPWCGASSAVPGFVVGLLALCVLVSVGCGGSEPAETNTVVGQQQPPVNEPPPPAAEAQPEENPADDGAMQDATAATEEVAEQAPEKRERPEDFSEWTSDDFRDEHAENGNRFSKAVEYLAENKVGDVGTAQLLSELLVYDEPQGETPAETEDKPDLNRPTLRVDARLQTSSSPQNRDVRVILTALGSIGTDVAIDTLTNVITGSLKTGFDTRQACELSLAMLMTIRDDKVQDFIYKAVTAPSKLRPADDEDFPPEQLRSRAIQELSTHATPALRTKLGKFAAKKGPRNPAYQGIWRLLSVPRADNLAGQLALYLSSRIEERESRQLRTLFTQHSRQVLNNLLGVPVDGVQPGAVRPSASAQPVFGFRVPGARKSNIKVEDDDADLTYEVVRVLWTQRLLAALSNELKKAGDIKEAVATIDLIASIPVDAVRQEIHDYWDDHWDEVSPQGDRQMPNQLAQGVQDPGLLLVFKSLPRRRDPKIRSERRASSKSTKDRRPQPRATASRPKDSRQLREEAEYVWLETTEQMVQAINARMLAAATALDEESLDDEDEEDDEIDDDETEDETSDAVSSDDAEPQPEAGNGMPADFELPFELHKGASVTATRHVLWPDQIQDRIKDQKLSPLEVRYVRIECEDVASKVTTHYQRQIKGAKTRYLENEGRWIDKTETLDTGWNQSIDIMVQRVGKEKKSNGRDQRRGRNEKEPLIVEILIVATEGANTDESEDVDDES